MTDISTLARELQRLGDIESIRQLKARYFHACDAKQPNAIKDCFMEGSIIIDYGAVGLFHDREEFVQFFEDKACHAHIIDMHHGQNAQIEWHSAKKAQAVWDLYFYQIDTKAGILTQLGGYYNDEFKNDGQGWRIQHTVFTATSSIVRRFREGDEHVLFAGKPG